MRLYQQERAIYEVTELLESLLGKLGLNRAQFAKRLGKSRGWVTQLLDGEANKTIRTVADAFAVLGMDIHSSYQPIQIGRKASSSTSNETTTRVFAFEGQVRAKGGIVRPYSPPVLLSHSADTFDTPSRMLAVN